MVYVIEFFDDFNVKVEDFCKVGEKVIVIIIGIDGVKVKFFMKEKFDVCICLIVLLLFELCFF